MTQAEIAATRYSQIDPSLYEEKELLLYFRLATGTKEIKNFAKSNPVSIGFEEADVELDGITFVEDFVEQV